jgi:hypothetical protein
MLRTKELKIYIKLIVDEVIHIGSYFFQTEETEEDGVNAEEVADESAKDEEELVSFWKESDELVFSAPTGHKLKDIAKYEVTVTNTLPLGESMADIETEKKVRYVSLLHL